ncbi:MAG TPA: hypothetical protein VK215_04530 [Acidimicrobiales bacterium]|nr:hypothetical protein [Acidimicrobiales bacterium]
MPIPAAPVGRRDVASSVLILFEQLHDQIREAITGLDEEGLNWSPGEGANTVATIVTHVLGSEAEALRCVAGVACGRDREGEFARVGRDEWSTFSTRYAMATSCWRRCSRTSVRTTCTGPWPCRRSRSTSVGRALRGWSETTVMAASTSVRFS